MPDDSVSDVIVHIGTNDLPYESPNNFYKQHKIPEISPDALADKITHVLDVTQKQFPNAKIFYSPIIPKYDNGSIVLCDNINKTMAAVCQGNNYGYIDTRPLFVKHKEVKWEKLSSRDMLHLNGAGIDAIAKHLKYAVVSTARQFPPQYTPGY